MYNTAGRLSRTQGNRQSKRQFTGFFLMAEIAGDYRKYQLIFKFNCTLWSIITWCDVFFMENIMQCIKSIFDKLKWETQGKDGLNSLNEERQKYVTRSSPFFAVNSHLSGLSS